MFEKYRQPDETAPRRLSAAVPPGVDKRRSLRPRHKVRKPTWGNMIKPQTAKNTVVPAPRKTAPPRTGPTTWPMFHWKLSTLRATGTTSGGTRLATVVHHDGDDVPLDTPMPAMPMSRVVGVRFPVDDMMTRNATEAVSRIFASRRMARRSRESAAAPEKTTAQMPASGLMTAARVTRTGDVVRPFHDEPADERDHPHAGVGEHSRELEPPVGPAAKGREKRGHLAANATTLASVTRTSSAGVTEKTARGEPAAAQTTG